MKRMQLLITCLACLGGMGLLGDKLIYRNDFTGPFKSNRFREVVEVKDLPGSTHAMKLMAHLRKDYKVDYGGWTARVPFGGYAAYQVDYAFKPMTMGSRYALFVTATRHKPVSLILKGGKIWSITGTGQWTTLGDIALGKWNRLRYVIKPVERRYDLYVNDMTKPLAQDLAFRGEGYSPLRGLWIEPSETDAAISYVTDIRIMALGEAGCVPTELAGSPLWVTVAKRATSAPDAQGRLSAADWQRARVARLNTSRGDIIEKADIRFLYDDRNLYCLFTAEAKNQAKRKPNHSGRDVKAYLDDSLELFLDPGHSVKDYYHLVTNAGSGRYEAKCCVGSAHRDRSWNPQWKVTVTESAQGWTAELAVPFESMGRGTPQAGEVWGALAGRVNPVTKEVGAWRPVSGFHCPASFGCLLFADEAYLRQPVKAVSRALTDRILLFTSLQSELETVLKSCEALNATRTAPLRKDFTATVQAWNKATDYAELTSIYDSLTVQKAKIERHRDDLERLYRFFGPGSEASRRGFAYCVDNSMVRVPLVKYTGTDVQRGSLTLAGRESGSFQIVFIAPDGKQLPGMDVAMAWQDTGKPVPGVEFYQVEEIGTAMSRQPKVLWPDALIPRTKMTWRKNAPAGVVWVDVHVPAGMAAGRYVGTITLKGGGQTVTVPVDVTVLPFDLPLKNTLPTAFCFSQYWVREYYGKDPSAADRKRYMQFILDHRLEPMNLWFGGKKMHALSVEELEWAEKRGKTCLFLPISKLKGNEAYYRNLVKRFEGRLKPYFFGHDEVLCVAYTGPGSALERMKRDYAYAKEAMPEVHRLNTAQVDARLFGYVNAWCPVFSNYVQKDAEERKALGEEVWWYPTDYPLKPYAVFNLDNPGMDSRLVPWMNWALGIDGLLYWGLNREWLTQVVEPPRFTPAELKDRGLEADITPATVAKLKTGARWPELRWIPFFRSVFNAKATPSRTNGGGNLIYPGPNFEPWPSTRLKNLRDGMQDYEYFALLKKLAGELKAAGGHEALVAECEAALKVSKDVVASPTSYTTVPERLLQEKAKVTQLILRALKAKK